MYSKYDFDHACANRLSSNFRCGSFSLEFYMVIVALENFNNGYAFFCNNVVGIFYRFGSPGSTNAPDYLWQDYTTAHVDCTQTQPEPTYTYDTSPAR